MEGAWVPNGTEEPTRSLTSRLHLYEEKTCCSNHPANDHRYLIDGILCLATQTSLAKSCPSVKASFSRKFLGLYPREEIITSSFDQLQYFVI